MKSREIIEWFNITQSIKKFSHEEILRATHSTLINTRRACILRVFLRSSIEVQYYNNHILAVYVDKSALGWPLNIQTSILYFSMSKSSLISLLGSILEVLYFHLVHQSQFCLELTWYQRGTCNDAFVCIQLSHAYDASKIMILRIVVRLGRLKLNPKSSPYQTYKLI